MKNLNNNDRLPKKSLLVEPVVSNQGELLIAFRHWTCNTDIRNFGNDYEAMVDEYLKSNSYKAWVDEYLKRV